ncbi:UNVERIFIED_CONTAM: Retrovirus-related Pol polyprotein from transposon RE1 [Sesamum angustifolium]|uniref:Retrovirus-related Pol polyprotein from transposon RE1 n=1 Tax=Sesamum angustifolium TaxID=2727405 RepID=A0AAW2N8Z4_9LAMI
MAEIQPTIASNSRIRTDLESSPSIENSSLTLVSAPLTGDNYLVWSRAVRFALGAKKKLSFIDGRSVRPTDNSEELDEWIRIDCMIITWILNSVSKEIVDAFIYATSARALWLELEARYGGSNGPMIYNLEREISSISQGDMSVTTYFTKIKMLWDELICLDPLPVCTCTAHRQTADREASRQLMRFLMGLSSVYEHVRRQILLMEPRPHVQKAFAMVLQVEKELQVQVHLPDTNNGVVYQLQHRDSRKDKRAMFCEHCRKSGHLKETCFKLHGTPEWYRDLTEKKTKRSRKGRGFVAAIETIPEQSSQLQIAPKPNLADLLRTEIRKMMIEENTSPHQMRTPLDNNIRINFARLEELDEAAGNPYCFNVIDCGSWIVDTGATRHVCADLRHFIHYQTPNSETKVHLPDGSTQKIAHIGTIKLSDHIILHHDLRTKESLAIGKLVGQLYFLDHNSFSVNTASNNTMSVNVASYSVSHSETNDSASLWHMRLGHSSFDALTHIPSITFKQPEWEMPCIKLLALDKNHTWEVTALPPGKKAIGCRWVYKLKLRDDGTVERCKARLVAKGYNQVAGVDYVDCFSPVAKAVTVRLFLAIASAHSWPLHQLDVNNAFLHGYLDEEIFMLPPEGYDVPQGHVCKLKRSLYGLKQASRQWNQEFTSQLVAFGFTQSSHDHCLFFMGSEDTFVAMLIYVDDVLITSPSVSLLTDVKSYLDGLFTIKDLGVARYFLGLQIARSPTGTSVTQTKYINDIVRDTGLMHAKSVTTPFPQHIKLSATGGAVLSDPEPYRRLVGRLLYLGFTRPDISYGVQQLSQFLQHPCESHWHAALHVVRYLKGTSTTGLFLPCSSSFQLQAYCDADWASCVDSRKSISGFCVFFGTSLISWKSKKQATVSRSSAEAEYRSMGATVCELLWISYLLQDFGIPLHSPIPLFCDNKAALHIMANPVFHERTKHLDIDCHIVRNQYKLGFVAPSFVRGKEQIADIFTKSLPASTFLFLLSKLALFSLDPSPPCGGSVGIQAVAATKSGDNDAEAAVCLLDAG